MTEPNIDSSPRLTTWKAESLRMTAILSPAAEFPSESLWEKLFGESPESTSSQPRTGIRQEQGAFGKNKLVIAVQPVRIDFIFSSDVERVGTTSEIPLMGIFVDSLNDCVDLMNRWLDNSPALQRLAFGANLVLPADNKQAAYEKLFDYLQFDPKNFENAQDFFYQINRPRISTSDVPGLKINRLSKWAVIQVAKFEILRGITPFNKEFFCNLELDINTSPDFQEDLPNGKLRSIFSEMVELGKEIAKEGDIK